MPQLLLQGFPDGAIRIGSTLSVLKKEGRVTYFVGSDNYFSHPETDAAGPRFALATLIANGHVRPSEVEASCLGIAHRTLMHWTRQLDEKGSGSFYAPRPRRGGTVMTPEKAAQCGQLLAAGETMAEVARRTGVGESTLRKAVRAGRVVKTTAPGVSACPGGAEGTTKSERGRERPAHEPTNARPQPWACWTAPSRASSAARMLTWADCWLDCPRCVATVC